MEKWTKGMECPRTVTVDDDIVIIKHVTQLKDGKFYMTTRVDLSDETDRDIKINAAYNMLIQDLRPRALKPYKSTEIDETKDYKPCDYPGNGGGLTTEERNVRFLKEIGLDDERVKKVMAKPEGLAEAINRALAELNNKSGPKVETKLHKKDEGLHTEG